MGAIGEAYASVGYTPEEVATLEAAARSPAGRFLRVLHEAALRAATIAAQVHASTEAETIAVMGAVGNVTQMLHDDAQRELGPCPDCTAATTGRAALRAR